jgi:hypothetical protein
MDRHGPAVDHRGVVEDAGPKVPLILVAAVGAVWFFRLVGFTAHIGERRIPKPIGDKERNVQGQYSTCPVCFHQMGHQHAQRPWAEIGQKAAILAVGRVLAEFRKVHRDGVVRLPGHAGRSFTSGFFP